MTTLEIADRFQPEFKAVINFLGPAEDFTHNAPLAKPLQSRDYQIYLTLPARKIGGFTDPSKVVMADIKKDPEKDIASFVVRNDNQSYQQLRKSAEKNPLAASLLGEYFPDPYYFDQTLGWVAVEKLIGLEGQAVVNHFQNPAFCELYAQQALTLTVRAYQAGLKLGDVCFVGGTNCMVEPNTAKIKLIEPETLEILLKAWQGSFDRSLGRVILEELRVGSYQRIGKPPVDKSAEARFLFSLCKLASQYPEWDTMHDLTLSPDCFVYIRHMSKVDPDFDKIPFNQQMKQSSDFFYNSGFRKTVNPALTDSIRRDDFSTFNQVLRQPYGFEILTPYSRR